MRSRKSSSAAFVIYSNEEPHVWPWQFSRVEGSPWNDIRVRKAANLCIDREGLKDGLLAGLMVPATGTFEPGHPWRGKPTFQIKYDKPAAQKLMQEAGFGPNKKLTVKIQTSASGSGQMLPLPMNEYLQQALAECYFDVQLDVIEWNTLFTNWRRGAKDASANGSNATNVTYAAMDPFFALVRFLQSSMAPPVSNNWGYINNPEIRRTGDQGAPDLRSGRARCGAGRTARGLRRRRGVSLCRPRRRAARHEPEDQGLCAAEELVRGLLADLDDAVRRSSLTWWARGCPRCEPGQ